MIKQPRYTYPLELLSRFVFDIIMGVRRSFRRDGLACVERLDPPLRILGQENIPHSGPCLITFNHYYRPGFNAWWMALALAAVVPVDIHFVMTGELTFPGKWYAPLGQAGSRWLLKRFAKIYAFTGMPPMPPRPRDVELRARSVRAALAFARDHPQAVLGLAPEGGDQPGGVVSWPPPGAGRFVLLLAEQGFPILPVGCFEEAGALCLRFGATYRLTLPHGLGADEKDRAAAGIIMKEIAGQLPPSLRGPFV